MWFRSLWAKASGCDSSPWVSPSRPLAQRSVTVLLGLRAVSPCGRKGLGGILVLLLMLVLVRELRSGCRRSPAAACPPPLARGQLGADFVPCSAHGPDFIRKKHPSLGRVRSGPKATSARFHLWGQYHGHFELPSVEQTVALRLPS